MAQLSIFAHAIAPTEDAHWYWVKFFPSVQKLHEERATGKCTTGGFSDSDWWRCRFSDFLTNTNSQPKTHEEWVYRKNGYALWEEIWAHYAPDMIN